MIPKACAPRLATALALDRSLRSYNPVMASSVTPSTAIPPGYAAARGKLAHRVRPTAVVDVAGDDRVAFLQGQLTQEMRGLAPGETREVAGLTPKGKLLFVGRAVGLADRIRLILPAAHRTPVF